MTTQVAMPTQRTARGRPQHLLSAEDLEGIGLDRLLDRAELLRSDRHTIGPVRPLEGRQVALLALRGVLEVRRRLPLSLEPVPASRDVPPA